MLAQIVNIKSKDQKLDSAEVICFSCNIFDFVISLRGTGTWSGQTCCIMNFSQKSEYII